MGYRPSLSMDDRFPYSPAEVEKVSAVQFGILSPDEIVNSRPPSLCPALPFPVLFGMRFCPLFSGLFYLDESELSNALD